jgi:DNA-binding LytR/AlgR family response regulator
MKIIVDVDDKAKEDEIIIRCKEKNDLVLKIEKYIKELNDIKLTFYKKDQEYYLNSNDILFFETDGNSISAHTTTDMYYVKYKLYELENLLPNNFIRVSKSTIVNINHILSINKNITSSSLIEFNKTHKQVFVSRFYYKYLKERLKERLK